MYVIDKLQKMLCIEGAVTMSLICIVLLIYKAFTVQNLKTAETLNIN